MQRGNTLPEASDSRNKRRLVRGWMQCYIYKLLLLECNAQGRNGREERPRGSDRWASVARVQGRGRPIRGDPNLGSGHATRPFAGCDVPSPSPDMRWGHVAPSSACGNPAGASGIFPNGILPCALPRSPKIVSWNLQLAWILGVVTLWKLDLETRCVHTSL